MSDMTSPAGVTADQLKQFIERVERIESDMRDLSDDRRDVYAEAKSVGYVPAIIREIVKLRRKDKAEREEMESLLDLYTSAIGGL